MKKDTNWNAISSLYIGTVIGAGFASGQEILQFFTRFGLNGILGAIVSTSLFIIIGITLLLKVHKDSLNSYQDLIRPVMGEKLGMVTDLVIISYLFMGVSIMVAGSGALFTEYLKLPYSMGVLSMVLLTLITILYNIDGVLAVNKILIPFLLFGVVIIGMIVIIKGKFLLELDQTEIKKTGWLKSAIMYVSYNIISVIVVLSSLKSVIKDKRTAIKGGLVGGAGLGLLSIFIIVPMLILSKEINNLEIPMLGVAGYIDNRAKVLYSIIIWIAMFTTSVSNSFGFLTRICDIININFKIASILFCLITIPVANLGFSKLVNSFYPLFGLISLLLILLFIIMNIYIKIKNLLV